MTKRCPKCGQSFADPNLNFCLNDGELLMYADAPTSPQFTDAPPPTQFADDSPPTLMMNDPRVTDPIGGAGTASPPVPWQGQQIVTPPGHYPVQYTRTAGGNQTLPIVALVLGIFSLVFVCCYGGIWLGIPAAIVGFIGLRNTNQDPSTYGGRGMAIAGMVLGVVTLILSIFVLILGLAGNLLQV